ncbi:hypothetical protein Vretimale_5598, partial [Volvox reticuliferus]
AKTNPNTLSFQPPFIIIAYDNTSMRSNIGPTALFLLLIAVTSSLAQNNYPDGSQEIASVNDPVRDAVTIKLTPLEKRKKGDLKALAERFKSLPGLLGASIVAAAPDILVLVLNPGQSLDQIRAVLLQQPEVYELEVDEKTYRREGDDKSYEELRRERLAQALTNTKSRIQDRIRAKLFDLLQVKRKQGSGDGAGVRTGQDGQPQDNEATRKAVTRAIKRATKRAARKGKRKGQRLVKKEDSQTIEL